MLGRIQAQAFGFDQTFQPYQKDDFVTVGMGREGSLLMFLGTLHDAFLEFGSNKKCNLGFVLFCFSGFFETVSHSVDQTSLAFAGILCLCHPSAIMTTLPISFTYLRDSALDYFTNL